MSLIKGDLVVVRGAGDLATGCILRLVRSGFRVAALESPQPSAIRRTVCLSEAIYQGHAEVEGIAAVRVATAAELKAALAHCGPTGPVPVLADPQCAALGALDPLALVDAIIAKRNLGTRIGMAPVVVALGPGFEAGVDADAVIETNRGHDLGRVILAGRAEPDTGTPGLIAGMGRERVLHAPIPGTAVNLRRIGDLVRAGDPVLRILGPEGAAVMEAPIDGMLRGLIRPDFPVQAGMKVGDVDPRGRREHCFTVSDKARAIAGGVLEAILMLGSRSGLRPDPERGRGGMPSEPRERAVPPQT
jgi:xanthine dehydrogenase accessory factor